METNSFANRKLATNTIIYFIGNFGSKILSLLLVMIYSSYIMPNDLGVYDLITTTILLLQPIIIFQLSDGIFRWLIEEEDPAKRQIQIKTVFSIVLINMAVSTFVLLFISKLVIIPYFWYFVVLLNVNIIYPLMQQITRGLRRNILFSVVGLSVSAVLFSVSLLLIIPFNLGVEGLLLSQIISQSVGILIMLFVQIKDFLPSFSAKSDKTIRRGLIGFSLPLIPNTISWWIINASDRYIISWKLGTYSNGIFSMANKFPSLMTVVTSIFNLAWQESAIYESDSKKRDEFYSDIFDKYLRFLSSAALVLIPLTRIVIEKFVGESYNDSWHYSSILYISTIFNALAAFLGTAYVTYKKTIGAFVTTIIAAGINLLIDIILIKFIGLYAAALSTLVSYFVLFLIRAFHTRKYFVIKYKIKTISVCLLLVVASFLLTEYLPLLFVLILFLAACGIALIYNIKTIKFFFELFVKKKGAKASD